MTDPATPSDPTSNNELREALAIVQPQIDALSLDTVPAYHLDATYAAAVVFDALSNVGFLAPLMARLQPFDHEPVQQLPTLARALQQTDALVNAHSPHAAAFDAEILAGRTMRDLLLTEAQLLVKRGRVSQDTVDKIHSGTRLRQVIGNLAALHELLAPYAGTVVNAAELTETLRLFKVLSEGLLLREGDDPELKPLLVQRRKAAGLLLNAYGQLQRAVDFLRYSQGDARTLVPPLQVPAGPRSPTTTATAPGTTPAAPMTTPVVQSAPLPPPAKLESLATPPRPGVPEEPSDRPFEKRK